MNRENKTELLMDVWVRLEEIKNVLAVVEKGLDAEIKTETGEMHSVMSLIKRQLEGVISEIDKNI